MHLLETRSLLCCYKSFLFLAVAILATLIGQALIGTAESKPAVIGEDKGKDKKKKEGKREFDPALISGKIFQGGEFEASGVVSVPGTDGARVLYDPVTGPLVANRKVRVILEVPLRFYEVASLFLPPSHPILLFVQQTTTHL